MIKVYYYQEDPIRRNSTYGNVQMSCELSLKSWLWEEEYPIAGVSKHGITSS